MMRWPFNGLQPAHYRVVVADPPWTFNDTGTRLAPSYDGPQRQSPAHYDIMSINDIKALPMAKLFHPDGGWLALWVPWALVPVALSCIESWGLQYVTAGVWVKTKNDGTGLRIGGGHHLRMASEPLLLARVGKKWPRARVRNIPNVWHAPRQEHSSKPECVQQDLELLWPGPYAELFARRRRPLWHCWGLEI